MLETTNKFITLNDRIIIWLKVTDFVLSIYVWFQKNDMSYILMMLHNLMIHLIILILDISFNAAGDETSQLLKVNFYDVGQQVGYWKKKSVKSGFLHVVVLLCKFKKIRGKRKSLTFIQRCESTPRSTNINFWTFLTNGIWGSQSPLAMLDNINSDNKSFQAF